MIPLIVLLLSIETRPDGEVRLRFMPERPVARAGGQLTVELDEAVFGEITGFEVFGATGDETAVALIEGRKALIVFSSNRAGIGAIADRPLLTVRTRAIGTPSFEAVKVTVSGSAWRIAEGPVPDDVPDERFTTVPAGRFQVQFPKQRTKAGEGGPFRGLAPGGLVIRNPQPFAVNVLFQATGLLREVNEENRFTLLPGETLYRGGPFGGYGRFFASADVEMAAIRWQGSEPGPVVSLSASPMTPPAGSRLIEWTAEQTSLEWRWQTGGVLPGPVEVRLGASKAPVLRPEFRVRAAARWLQAIPAATRLTVTVDPRGLPPGVYRDVITIEPVATEFFAAGPPLAIGVVLTVSNEAEQKLSFRSRSFPLFHLEQFRTSEPSAAFTTTVYQEGSTWLSAIPMGGFFQGTVAVASNGDLLEPGYYGGHVVLRGANFSDVVQVTTMRSGGEQIETASAVRFVMAAGGKAPEAQRLPVLTPRPYSATVRTDNGGSWLTRVAEAGAITIGVNAAGLAAGAYTGMVSLRAALVGPRQIPVTLLIYPNPAAPLVANPAVLDLRTTVGVSTAATVAITSGLLVERLQWLAETDAGASGWLAVEQAEQGAVIRTDVSMLPAGVYTGRVTARTSMQSVVVPVRLTVSAPEVTDDEPFLGSILNAASWREVPVAAGEEVVLYGGFILGASIDGIPVAARGFVVPPELAGRREVTLRLRNGNRTRDYVIPLAEAAPGVYSLNGTGKGLALVRNANGTSGSVGRGTMVWLQATGLRRDDVGVEVGGVRVRAMNVFPLVEDVAGRDWIEFVVPVEAPVGEVGVVVISAGMRSQKGVTMVVE
ncbi:MAG: hypothetical protein JNK48_34290 [Bryobacterales bacterium]|nr:hypothetical protein [Bryobacterales bacterium]